MGDETERGGGRRGREGEGEGEGEGGKEKDLTICCQCQTCWHLQRVNNPSCRITDFRMPFREGVFSQRYLPLHVRMRRGRARAVHRSRIRRGHVARPHLRVRLYARPPPRPIILGTAADDGEMISICAFKETRTTAWPIRLFSLDRRP
jgi:hypothetical protein